MNPELAETVYIDFITSSPTTGAAVDADTLPTAEVFEDATDTAIVTPTITKRTGKTGDYRVPVVCTSANGFEVGKSYNVIVAATVGGVAAKAIVQAFQVRAVAVAGASQASVDAIAGKLPAALVGGRMDSSVGAMANGVFTSSAVAIDAYTRGMFRGALQMGIVEAGATTTTVTDSFFSNATNYWKGMQILFIDGSIAGQCRLITAFDSATHMFTFTPDTVGTATAGNKFEIHKDASTISASGTALTPTDLNAIADALLKRDWNSVTGEAAYSALNAFRMLRNVWNTTGGTLSVKKEDGTTNAWTRTLAVDPTAQPITGAS
jgi:hypothetical protein